MREDERRTKNCMFDKSNCDSQGDKSYQCACCYISTEESVRLRRCFMTGEYCSQQPNIQRERKEAYKDNSITAFVVMNFSDMSDVVYKWRLHNFIESLTKYLYIDKDKKRLYCSVFEKADYIDTTKWEKVKNIKVVRSDTDLASNYIICSRVCQQMQIADLVIVDVSSQNPNVFYEFGMAVALGKLILPICYSESYYKMVIPEKYKEKHDDYSQIEHHIGCYPWRKALFEYYGIRYRCDLTEKSKTPGTTYFKYEEAIKAEYGFSDRKYSRFPYHEEINGEVIGKTIYNKLHDAYNNATSEDNTLIVYTMEGFLNEEQAGRCIVNFYHSITARMCQEQCFCGERVGVLVQENVIPERDRDSKSQVDLYYNVGEIIHIGLNQATYLAAEEKIKTEDFLSVPSILKEQIEEGAKITDIQEKEIKRYVKEYIRNRGMLIYPNNPVYVNRMKNQLHENILDNYLQKESEVCDCCSSESFCLYHVMLRNLCCTNEIVVDISNNCLQSLFWLGAAHGMDIYAITVRHEETEKEFPGSGTEGKTRNIFDVAGLWTAILRSNDTEGFYEQLASAQKGIERHSKLMASNRKFYKQCIEEQLSSFDSNYDEKKIEALYKKEQTEEKLELESYYRRRFWNPMLHYNRLRIYLPQKDEKDEKTKQPRLYTSKWDFDAVSALSHYLSKRTVIGEYRIRSLQKEQKDEEAEQLNFICVGEAAKPLDKNLPDFIYSKIGNATAEETKIFGTGYNVIHRHKEGKLAGPNFHECIYKGFERVGKVEEGIFTSHTQTTCINCPYHSEISSKLDVSMSRNNVFYHISDIEKNNCSIIGSDTHSEVAQLILWREDTKNLHERSLFRVAMIGSSGPATYALSALFVDQEQKENYFESKEGKAEEQAVLLCELQAAARKKFMEIFLIRLQEKLDKIQLKAREPEGIIEELQKQRYFSLVKHSVASYLSTVLYRYFLPFLSEKDISRIYNGMRTFVNSMKAAGVSPFAENYPYRGDSEYSTSVSNANIKEIVSLIPEELLIVLKNFKGIEAFYLVTVQHREKDGRIPDKDTRSVQDIRMLEIPKERETEISNVNCFFTFEL